MGTPPSSLSRPPFYLHFTFCSHQTASPPPHALWSHLSLPSSSFSLHHHLPYDAFQISSQHALVAPSLNLSVKAHRPPATTPWSSQQNIPKAFSLLGAPTDFLHLLPQLSLLSTVSVTSDFSAPQKLDPASGPLHVCFLYLQYLFPFHHPIHSAWLPCLLVQGSAQVSSDQPI